MDHNEPALDALISLVDSVGVDRGSRAIRRDAEND